MESRLVPQSSVASNCVMQYACHCSREHSKVWKEISILQSSSTQETHIKAQNSMNQSLDRTSQVQTKMTLHQLQVPAFWIPGSCSNYCCHVADPQPGTYITLQALTSKSRTWSGIYQLLGTYLQAGFH